MVVLYANRRPKRKPEYGRHTTHSSLLRLTTITAAVIELLIKRVWLRIQGTRPADASAKISPTPSPAIRLSQEVVEMIIAHLIYNGGVSSRAL
jgi:hypothetical protein